MIPRYPTSRAVRAVRDNDLCLNTSPVAEIYDAIWDDVACWLSIELRYTDAGTLCRVDRITDEAVYRIMNSAVV